MLRSDEFGFKLFVELKARANKLKGLALVGMAADSKLGEELTALGYVLDGNPVQAVPKAVPADYAAFTILLR